MYLYQGLFRRVQRNRIALIQDIALIDQVMPIVGQMEKKNRCWDNEQHQCKAFPISSRCPGKLDDLKEP